MELACPKCGTRFQVPEGALGPHGRQVRCGACGHLWHAEPPAAAAEEVAAAPEPAAPPPTELASALGSEAYAGPGTASRRRGPPPLAASSGPRWGLLVGWLLFFALIGGLVGGGWYFRDQVVAQVPQTARLYELLGVPLAQPGPDFVIDWKRAIRTEQTGPTVTLSGQVINATQQVRPAPQLAVELLNGEGRQIDGWAVELGGGAMAPGEARDFSTKGPWPEVASDVSVRLLD